MVMYLKEMEEAVFLEWSYSPSDYFEEKVVLERDTYTMTIEKGMVVARIDPGAYDSQHKMRGQLHELLNDRFRGVQMLTHKPYELSDASMYRLHSDGRKDITVFPDSLVIKTSVGTPDIIVKDKDGNEVSNSRRERIEKNKSIADLTEKYRSTDDTLASILESYDRAVNDPDNEFVHLYEIRDALASRFGSDNSARSNLGISKADWSKLGRLSNDSSLYQGRHRGKKHGSLRNATESELNDARGIARTMYEAYLNFLERQAS